MRQLVFIHGGETFDSYEQYLSALRSWSFDPAQQHQKRWRDALAETLGSEWEVIIPRMPSAYNAKYLEWKIWFEKVIPFLGDGAVFVGHSLGGTFLAKFLSEETLPINSAATLIVAAPFDADGEPYSLGDFTIDPDKSLTNAGKVFLYFSKDDPIVSFANLAKFESWIPGVHVRVFEDRGHFLQEEFPEIAADISTL